MPPPSPTSSKRRSTPANRESARFRLAPVDSGEAERRECGGGIPAVVLARHRERARRTARAPGRVRPSARAPATPRRSCGAPPRRRTWRGGRARCSSRPRSRGGGARSSGRTRRPRPRASPSPSRRSRRAGARRPRRSRRGRRRARGARRRSSTRSSSCRGRPRRRSPAEATRARRGTRPAAGPRRAPRCAVETTTSHPYGGAGSPPTSTATPSSVSMKIVSRRSQPRTSAPQRARDVRVRREPCASDADEVDPPALQRPVAHDDSRSAARRAAQLVGDLLRSIRPGQREHRLAHPPETFGIVEQLVDERRDPVQLFARRTTTAPPPRSKWTALRTGGRPSHAGTGRGSPASRPRPAPRPFRPLARSARSAAASASPNRCIVRKQHVVAPRHPRPRGPRSRGRRRCAGRPGLTRRTSRRRTRSAPAAPASPPNTARRACPAGSPKAARPRSRSAPRWARGMGRPTTRYFPAVPAGHLVCEEHAAREWRREPVRETEVRVRLRQGRGDAFDARRQHHRARRHSRRRRGPRRASGG